MKKITLFYLENCPYCRNAKKAMAELKEEKAEYAAIAVDWIEESTQPALAAQYDYYYVPTVFFRGRKLYEANPGESYAECLENIRAVLDAVCSAK